MRVTILGCGGSGGVPLVGGNWGACDPRNPRNQRTRVSILVEEEGTRILVDTSPDLRRQCLAAKISGIDAVLFSHDHADHCHGIDDLRALVHAHGKPIDAYADAKTERALKARFAYAFAGEKSDSIYPPLLAVRTIDGSFKIGEITVVPFVQAHGSTTTLGFRFGPLGSAQ